jgi:hypothetical protein
MNLSTLSWGLRSREHRSNQLGQQAPPLWLSVALRAHGIATTLLAGDATLPGLELAARYGLPADAYRVSEVLVPDSLQWTPAPEFAGWLGPGWPGPTWRTPT